MGGNYFGAGLDVLLIRIARTEASIFFNKDLVTTLDELISGRGQEGNPSLLGFDLAWNTDDHGLHSKRYWGGGEVGEGGQFLHPLTRYQGNVR